MEKAVDWEQNTLLFELNHGKELAEQLRSHHLNPSSPPETCLLILEKILFSYDKTLSMINLGASMGETKPMAHVLDSPNSRDVSDHDSKGQFRRDVNKKRKTQPRWTEQVKVCSGTVLEGPLDDGYSWRKYGQKDILGSNHPRGYYRCTHRHSQGCLAVKQVQRSDQDPAVFEVTYRGRHTCCRQAKVSVPNGGSKQQILDSCQVEEAVEEKPKPFHNVGEEIRVKTENLDSREDIFPSFPFPNNIFMESTEENNILGDLSPAFLSPTTSDSNYLSSMSPYHLDNFGMVHISCTSESDHTEIVSAPTSVTNSPIGDFEITIESVDFDKIFAEILA